ncbi:MAG: 16S rRNA (guanine(527)-N(7))-methyltransferase RsmG [Tepidanaerobacteraceae bacterium]|jgi:16S rRNA (guanine527-N7)-methyltransferase|nr:16S rRNA (guanine(527)-N(7))-methyltransferase RsmG [Tepidanaerobacteraceae bacterium]
MNDFEILKSQILKSGMDIGEGGLESILKYMDLILAWNKKINLTGITKKKDFIEKHVIDSLMVTKLIKIENCSSMIDIGTGAGIPGILIKIARPDLKMILVEAIRKKADFLNEAVSQLGIKNIEIVNERSETAAKKEKYREKSDIAVARAVSSLKVLAELCLPFVKKDGIFIAMKGEKAKEEINEARNSLSIMGGEISDIIEYKIANLSHRLIIIKKIASTPEKYPRRPGMPEKNPL